MQERKRVRIQALWLIVTMLQGYTNAHSKMIHRRLGSSSSNQTKSNSSQYKNPKRGYSSSYDDYYSNEYYSGARDFSVCDGSVVKVYELYVLCDSPYTFYYGNGAHRNSPVCNYGDKVTFQVRFRVTDDLQENAPIYTTIAIYDDQKALLLSTDPLKLCEDYVGSACTYAGYYKFSTRMRLPYPSSDSSSAQFLPQIHMAFSTQADYGYNLGAMNIQCQQWNDGASWLPNKRPRSALQAFVVDYGLLLISCTGISALCVFLWKQAGLQLSGTCCTGSEKSSIFIDLH
jgi:hypothetical protein